MAFLKIGCVSSLRSVVFIIIQVLGPQVSLLSMFSDFLFLFEFILRPLCRIGSVLSLEWLMGCASRSFASRCCLLLKLLRCLELVLSVILRVATDSSKSSSDLGHGRLTHRALAVVRLAGGELRDSAQTGVHCAQAGQEWRKVLLVLLCLSVDTRRLLLHISITNLLELRSILWRGSQRADPVSTKIGCAIILASRIHL